LDADFDLGLVPRPARASRQYGYAVMLGQVSVTGVDIRFVTVRFGNAAAQIVRHQDLRCTAEKGEAAYV
jgi:hypothetical protein